MKIIRTLDGSHIEATGEELARWKEDPVAFVRDLLGRELSEWEAQAIREQARMVEYEQMLQEYGFSLRGTAPADDPDNVTVESFQIVPRQHSRRITSAAMMAAIVAVQSPALPSPEELAEQFKPEDWTYAAPAPEQRGRQAFKEIANRRRKGRRR